MRYKALPKKRVSGRKNEAIIGKKAFKSFNDQKKYLIDNGEDVYTESAVREKGGKYSPKLSRFFISMGVYKTADSISKYVFNSLDSGYKSAFINHRADLASLGVAFDTTNVVLKERKVNWRELQISERDGSIAKTTKKDVAKILQQGIQEGQSRTELTKKIEDLGTFSKSRAKLIATQETGNAFGYGNFVPMQEAMEQGATVLKKWDTVDDALVRPEHTQNQDDGWIDIDEAHSGTGDMYAPSSVDFNCRCTEQYKIK